MNFITRIDQSLYPNHSDHWDSAVFREIVLSYMRPEMHLLDLGAGAGHNPAMNFRGRAHISGCDPDPCVALNPFLDDARVCHAESLPWDTSTFDVVICNNVLEHLERPEAAFREVRRVLKPDGRFLFATPNRFHYVPLLASLTPHHFHLWANRMRGRNEVDTFPTYYRANTQRRILRLAHTCDFLPVQLVRVEGRPEYLRWCAPLYLCGAAYERFVNSTKHLAWLRVVLIGVLQAR